MYGGSQPPPSVVLLGVTKRKSRRLNGVGALADAVRVLVSGAEPFANGAQDFVEHAPGMCGETVGGAHAGGACSFDGHDRSHL